MILKVFYAILFTNILGILYDILEGTISSVKRKFYLNWGVKILMMLFFRSIIFIIKGFITFKKKDLLNSISLIIFVLSIYFILNFEIENLKNQFKFSAISTFIFWSITYAYISVSSDFFYEGKDLLKLSDREMKIYSNEAKLKDKLILFFQNLILSIITPHIYILSIITTLYVFLIRLIS